MNLNADKYIRLALEEDITSGDISTDAVITEYKKGAVSLICKQSGVICGLSVFERVFKILDEKVNYSGYSPENFDKKYHGYVSVTDSIKNSYNVPAVKTLNTLTVKTAEKYLTKMNIALEDDEKNLALALGGMKYGLSLKNLTDMYSVFPAGGAYTPSRFIKKIVAPNGKTIFENVQHPS